MTDPSDDHKRISSRDLIQFIVQVRKLSSTEGNEKRALARIRNLANQMYRDHIGYDYRGDFRIKRKGESIYAASVRDRRAFLDRAQADPVPDTGLTITSLGYSGVWIRGSQSIVVDPLISGQVHPPLPLSMIDPLDLILVTQKHRLHRGDAAKLARLRDAPLITPPASLGVEEGRGLNKTELNLGGVHSSGDLRVRMVEARHLVEGSAAVGYVIEIDGHVLYHAGATARFDGMERIAREFNPRIVFLPISGVRSMGIQEAVGAVETLRPLVVMPIMYGTFPEIEQDPTEFAYHVGETAQVQILRPGETWKVHLNLEAPRQREGDHRPG